MFEIYFENQNKTYPFCSAQIADILNSFLIDWSSCKNLVYALISANDPLISSVILLRSHLPEKDLHKLWQNGNVSLQTQLIYYDRFLINFSTDLAAEINENSYILAALALRWNYIKKNVSKKTLSAKTRTRIEKLIEASNATVKEIWNAVNGNSASTFLKAYINDASIDFETAAKFNTQALEFLPYLPPLSLLDLINYLGNIKDKEAKHGLIDFILKSPCAIYRLAMVEELKAKDPEMQKFKQDPDCDVAAVANGACMAIRHRQASFLVYPSELPYKLSPKKEEDYVEDNAIRKIVNNAIPDTESLAIFEYIYKNKTFLKDPLKGENSLGYIIAEVVEKYVDDRQTLEANWNLKLLRGKAEKVFICIGKEKVLLPFQILLAISADCVYTSNAASLARALYDLPSSHIKALIIENSDILADDKSDTQSTVQLTAWQSGDSLILCALLKTDFVCFLTDTQAKEIIAVNDPLMLKNVCEAISSLTTEDTLLSKEVLYELIYTCAHSRDPRVRDSLYENLDYIGEEERIKYNLEDIFKGLEAPKATYAEQTGQEIMQYLHDMLSNSESE